MPSLVTVFDHFMKPITQLDVATTPRSWVYNDVGRCEFTISTSDPKCTEANLQYGNLILVEHLPSVDENNVTHGKLPNWVGIIMPPRTWDYGALHVTAYSAESIMTVRPMPYQPISGTPKAVFQGIIQQANAVGGNILFQHGVMDDIGKQFSDDLRVSAYEHIVKLVKNSGMTWNITGELGINGNLVLYANLYNSLGIATDLEMNNLNSELKSPLLSEQGIPQNVVNVYSYANTPQTRRSAMAVNEGAFADYGYMGVNITAVGDKGGGIITIAENKAAASGRPKKRMSRVALDYGDTFSKLALGNTLTIVEKDAGFAPEGGFGVTATAMIISMEYNDLSNKVPLNLEILYG